MNDKVLHSAVGLGAYLTAFLSIILGASIWILLAPLLLGLSKELIDVIKGGIFDMHDLLATLNPMIVIKWYIDIVN